MNIREAIAVLNRMEADGIVDRYAIGGAVGATFYLEPAATFDMDVFITFRPEAGQIIVSPQRIFEYLKARGSTMEGEYIIVCGWPVQFLPAGSPLLEEALNQSVQRDVDGTPARVFAAEHLAAIALEIGRAKDKTRLLQFIESRTLDPARFESILARHGLVDAWRTFERQFLKDIS